MWPPTFAFWVYPLRRSGKRSRACLLTSLIITFSTIFSAKICGRSPAGASISVSSKSSSSSSIRADESGCESLDPSLYKAFAFTPNDQDNSYAAWQSSIVASFGIFIVFDIAPEIKDCAAAIMVIWLSTDKYRVPIRPHTFAQSKTP